MRESTRRECVLVFTVAVHGLIIYELATSALTVASATRQQPITITFIDKPRGLLDDVKPAALSLNRLTPALSPISYVPVKIPAEPPPAPKLASEQTAASDPSAASNSVGVTSTASGTALEGEGAAQGIAVYHRVQPIYPRASEQAREEGDVVVGVLIDELGHVGNVEVVQSSGFRRLDQSVVDALRQWTFAPPGNGSQPERARTKVAWSFHLGNGPLNVSIILIPFDPAVAEQIHAAAVPLAATQMPSPHGANALRRLIAAIRTGAPPQSRREPRLSERQLLAKLGAVRSVRFLGIESRGFDVNDIEQAPDTNRGKSHQWELYEVEQQGGKSEWLIDVTRYGMITTAQAMTCVSPCRGF
ncbi:MAG TPA: energy transducer TonB [Steroidobacteraceae bacterium]